MGQGNIFTGVCHSAWRGGLPFHSIVQGQTPPLCRAPQADTPPGKDTTGYGQQAGGTHPTGMHTFLD